MEKLIMGNFVTVTVQGLPRFRLWLLPAWRDSHRAARATWPRAAGEGVDHLVKYRRREDFRKTQCNRSPRRTPRVGRRGRPRAIPASPPLGFINNGLC